MLYISTLINSYLFISTQCEKQATGPLDRKKLLDYINDQALNTPDIPDAVPHVPGTVRGKKVRAFMPKFRYKGLMGVYGKRG